MLVSLLILPLLLVLLMVLLPLLTVLLPLLLMVLLPLLQAAAHPILPEPGVCHAGPHFHAQGGTPRPQGKFKCSTLLSKQYMYCLCTACALHGPRVL